MQRITATITDTSCLVTLGNITAKGFGGKGGATFHKGEGDGKTPLGCFAIRYGFYIGQKPTTRLPLVQLTPYHHFIDDIHSPCYNKLVFGKPKHHAERMLDYPHQYEIGLVIEYNRSPTAKGKGSAIFLHCGHQPTAGCIAIPKESLLSIFNCLDPNRSPHIIINRQQNPPI